MQYICEAQIACIRHEMKLCMLQENAYRKAILKLCLHNTEFIPMWLRVIVISIWCIISLIVLLLCWSFFPLDYNTSEQKQACKKHELYVSFRDLGWQVRHKDFKSLVKQYWHSYHMVVTLNHMNMEKWIQAIN